jgi:hypothetical protein
VFSDTAMAAYNDILDSAVATSLGIIGEANNTNGGGTGLYGTAVSSVNATVGDPIRYSAAVQLSEGQQNDLQLTVNLPNGMTFLNDGSITIELVSPDGSIIAVDFGSAASASYGSASFNPNTAKATFQLPANQITANPDGTVTFDLAQVNDNRAVIDGSMCSAWSPLRATSPPNWPAQPSPPSPSSVRYTRARRKDALNDRMR